MLSRHSFIYAFDAVEPNPLERACFEPGRARRRHDLSRNTFLALDVTAEFGDADSVRATSGIVRPDRHGVARNGRYPRVWRFDYIAAGV